MPAKSTKKTTVTVQDREGNDIEVAVGLDGKNPVSINNPSPKAVAEEDHEALLEYNKGNEVPAVEVVETVDSDSLI